MYNTELKFEPKLPEERNLNRLRLETKTLKQTKISKLRISS